MRNSNKLFLFAMAVAFLAAMPGAAFGSITYLVTANTSSVSGQMGYLDLQLEPGPATTNLVTANVNNFMSDGALVGSAQTMGNAIGQLPGALTFDNANTGSDYFQGVTFGNTESFDVTLNGPTPAGGEPSAFNISFYGADQVTSILSTDTVAGQILINGDGSTSTVTIPATPGGTSVVSITATPEPSYIALLIIALTGLIVFGRLRLKPSF